MTASAVVNVFVAATDCSSPPPSRGGGTPPRPGASRPRSSPRRGERAALRRELKRGHDLGRLADCETPSTSARESRSAGGTSCRAMARRGRPRAHSGPRTGSGRRSPRGPTCRARPGRPGRPRRRARPRPARLRLGDGRECRGDGRRLLGDLAPHVRGHGASSKRSRAAAGAHHRGLAQWHDPGAGYDSLHARSERVVQRHRAGEVHAARDHQLEGAIEHAQPARDAEHLVRERSPLLRQQRLRDGVAPAATSSTSGARSAPNASPPRVIASKRSSTSRTPTASQNAPARAVSGPEVSRMRAHAPRASRR